MPLTYGTTTTANFIADIHDAIGDVYSGQPIYDCDATGVYSDHDMGTVLKTEFNYSYADKADYNRHVVVNNIESNNPVILRGDDGGSTGHMWVCDGYRSTTYHFDDCTGATFLHFYMNWGWYDGQFNGWYSFDNFNPGNSNYNNDNEMIYNITP